MKKRCTDGYKLDVIEYSFSEGSGFEIPDRWVQRCVRAAPHERVELVRERLASTIDSQLDLGWFTRFSEPIALIMQGATSWIECACPNAVAGTGVSTMWLNGRRRRPVREAEGLCVKARSELEELSEYLGGVSEGCVARGYFGGGEVSTGPTDFGPLTEAENVWEDDVENWNPAVVFFRDPSCGSLLMREDGACGWATNGDEIIKFAFPSLSEFLERYVLFSTKYTGINYWDAVEFWQG